MPSILSAAGSKDTSRQQGTCWSPQKLSWQATAQLTRSGHLLLATCRKNRCGGASGRTRARSTLQQEKVSSYKSVVICCGLKHVLLCVKLPAVAGTVSCKASGTSDSTFGSRDHLEETSKKSSRQHSQCEGLRFARLFVSGLYGDLS